MKFKIIVLSLAAFILLQCKEEEKIRIFTDPRDGNTYEIQSAGGTDWFTKDLNVNGNELFTYNQALLACPDGWRLPNQEEWRNLLIANGGYLDYSEPVGEDLSGAYDRLISTLKFTPDQWYWGGGATWRDIPSIRTDIFWFNSGNDYGEKEIWKAGNTRTSLIHCRCVKDTPKKDEYISLQTDSINTTYRYGIALTSTIFYVYDNGMFVPTPEFVVITGFGDLENDLVTNFFYMTLPEAELLDALNDFQGTSLQTEVIPYVLVRSRDFHEHSIELSTFGAGTNVRLVIHSYENDVLEGEVTGFFSEPDPVEIETLTFKVDLSGTL